MTQNKRLDITHLFHIVSVLLLLLLLPGRYAATLHARRRQAMRACGWLHLSPVRTLAIDNARRLHLRAPSSPTVCVCVVLAADGVFVWCVRLMSAHHHSMPAMLFLHAKLTFQAKSIT